MYLLNKTLKLILLISLLLSTNALAKTINDKSLTQIMELSGLNEQIAQYPLMIVAGMEQAKSQGSPVDENKFSKVKSLLLDSYNANIMLRIIKDEIKKNTSQKDADVLLKWYKSKLGMEITQAEKDSTNTSAYESMIQEAPVLLQNKKRVYFARMVDRSIDATQMTIQIQKNSSVAIFTAISKIMEPEKDIDVEKFKIMMAAQDKQIEVNIEQMTILSFVYSYKNISIQNLETYVVFLQKEDVRRFNKSIVNGIVKALNNASDKMTKKLN